MSKSYVQGLKAFRFVILGASSTGASSIGSTPTTLYILMRNFIIS